MDESLSIENQILLCCARRDVDPAAIEALVDDAAAGQRGVNWDALLAAARVHHLLPLLYERLAAVGGDLIPPDVMARLRGAYGANLVRNRRLGAELAEVVDSLGREGVEVIFLKGGALAWTVYADPAQRPMADLDLLVRLEQVGRASAVLQSLGFRLPASIPADMVHFQQQIGAGLGWLRSRRGSMTCLDLHHHLIGVDWCRAAFPVDPDALWASARPLALDGTQAWQLSAEDTLIHLCLHPALNHGYASPLLGYVDMDRLVTAADGGPSWPRLVERAERFGVKTTVYLGLQCAHQHLATPVPPEVLATLQPGRLQSRLLRRLAPVDQEAVLKGINRHRGAVERVLFRSALADQAGATGGIVRGFLFPSEEWLATRYALKTRSQARRYRLVHPLRVARDFLRTLHPPLVRNSLE
jgi:hypothetical protein